MRKRRKVRKRLYMVIAFLVISLSIFLAKILQDGSADALNLPVMRHEDAASDTNPEKRPVVCLDPGHGGHDVGGEGKGIFEKDVNLKIGLQVGKLLEKNDYTILYTRTTDKANGDTQKEDVRARCDISNNAGADIYVSLHCNIDKASAKSRGVELWCRFPNQKGEELAKSLDKQLAQVGYTKDRGLRYESDGGLYVLQNTKAVAALVELGFLSNAEDRAFLNSEQGQAKCAAAIAKGIEEYINANFHQKK